MEQLLVNQIESGVAIPEELKSYVSPNDTTPWHLAERLVMALIKDPLHESSLKALMESMRAAAASDFAAHALVIADSSLELLQTVLQTPKLNMLFDKKTALITIYFFVVFVMVCAGLNADVIMAQEGVIVRVATLANRLLLNRQVYENAARALLSRLLCCLGLGRK